MSFTCDYKCEIKDVDMRNCFISIEAFVYRPESSLQITYLVYSSEQAKISGKECLFRESINIPSPFEGWACGISAVMTRAEDAIREKIAPQILE